VSRIDAITQQQMAKANESQTQQRLVEIDAALDRIEQKDYGYCDECGCNVIFARLQIKPEAQFCISCQSKME
jgi:DnaK suppressor protein